MRRAGAIESRNRDREVGAMEALLLVASVCAVVMLAYRVYRSERPKGDPGLGIFGFRESLGKARPQARGGKPNA